MKRLIFVTVICLLTVGSAFAQIRWITTRNGNSSGNCRVQINKLKVIVHPLHADIEEEVEITTTGRIWQGDAESLEIINEFSVSPGTAIRSLLLWNGNQLLKGKLKLKEDADKEYEEVVDRQQVQTVIRDPALIEYMGQDRYRCRIYPVPLNGTRKIRVLYSVPLRTINGVPQFEISTLFPVGTQDQSDLIPLQVSNPENVFTTYIMKTNSSQKAVEFGAVYLFSYKDIIYDRYRWSNSIQTQFTIVPKFEGLNYASSTHIPSGAAKGYYTAIVSPVPEAFAELADKKINPLVYSIQAGLTIGNQYYLIDVNSTEYWAIYCKTDTSWNGVVNWTAFDQHGNSMFKYTQKITPEDKTYTNSDVPLVWGMKYSLIETKGNTGALFGFVDQTMSLLALESDVMNLEEAADWNKEGVPLLLPEEIIIDSTKLPQTPQESIIIDHNTSAITPLTTLANFSIEFDREGYLKINLSEANKNTMSIRLLDAAGRVVHRWKSPGKGKQSFALKCPGKLHGFYIVQITIGNNTVQKKILVP